MHTHDQLVKQQLNRLAQPFRIFMAYLIHSGKGINSPIYLSTCVKYAILSAAPADRLPFSWKSTSLCFVVGENWPIRHKVIQIYFCLEGSQLSSWPTFCGGSAREYLPITSSIKIRIESGIEIVAQNWEFMDSKVSNAR